MRNSYVKESERLDALAEAMKLVAGEFEQDKQAQTAVAVYVLSGLVLKQLSAMDEEIDIILAQAGI